MGRWEWKAIVVLIDRIECMGWEGDASDLSAFVLFSSWENLNP